MLVPHQQRMLLPQDINLELQNQIVCNTLHTLIPGMLVTGAYFAHWQVQTAAVAVVDAVAVHNTPAAVLHAALKPH